MSSLVSIAAVNDSGATNTHQISLLPVVVIFPHNQCNCRCMMCDIWRIREAREITPEDLERQLSSFRKLGVRWAVLSGGEPQLNEKWSYLAQMLRSAGIRVTLLTAGLLLEAQAEMVASCIDDVIVSLDGPPTVHDRVRRVVGAFEEMAEGVRALHQIRPEMEIRARCTVQKANHHSLRAVVEHARRIGLTSVSFLAADLTSTAFNRQEAWLPNRAAQVSLSPDDVDALEVEIDRLISEDHNSRFIVESPQKLRRIVQHFRAYLGQAESVSPRCNAPWVSAVIEATGDVRPCFFHGPLGNIHDEALHDIINGPQAVQFRADLDIATNETCRRCICSLYISPSEPIA